MVEPNALADVILVNGDPLADMEIIGDPGPTFDLIMKDDVIYKNE